MRLSAALVGLTSVAATAASGFAFNFGRKQATINGDLKIPGSSPLELCPKAHEEDIVTIDHIDLVPNPPQAGQSLVITAAGTVLQPIEEGAYVALEVKYGLIRLISTKADLCEQVKNVDLECPIEAGDLILTKVVDLPREIPPGKYTVLADVYTQDDEPITCLTADIYFGSHKAAQVEL